MAALPYIQLYPADYLADTMHLTTEEHGAYLLLIFNYWQTGKPIPKSRLASIAKLSNDRWISVEVSLNELFIDNGKEWVHKRIEADLQAVNEAQAQRSNAGKASAEARKQQKRTAAKLAVSTHDNGRSTVVASPLNGKSTNKDTDTDTDTEKNLKAKGDKSPLVLPDWLPAELWDDWHNYRNSRKGWTAKARKLSLATLCRLHDEGQDARTVINLAIERGWTGLFAPRAGPTIALIKPPIAQNFSQKNYSTTGTPDNELPDFLRANQA